jgi:hypothetical protein
MHEIGTNINVTWTQECLFIFRQFNIEMLHYPSIGWLKTRQSLKRKKIFSDHLSFENKPHVICHRFEL